MQKYQRRLAFIEVFAKKPFVPFKKVLFAFLVKVLLKDLV